MKYTKAQVQEAADRSGCSLATMYRRLQKMRLDDASFTKVGSHQTTTEGKSWYSMIRRCTVPTHPSWKAYGGRGITVCDRWRHSFQNFLDDMGKKPVGKNSIDRIDNDGNYEPGNCRWSDPREQGRNKGHAKRPYKESMDPWHNLCLFSFEILTWD